MRGPRRASTISISNGLQSSSSLETTSLPANLLSPANEPIHETNPYVEIDNSAQLDLAMVVRNSLLLSKAYVTSDIVPQLLKHLLQVAGAQAAAFVVEDQHQKYVLSATALADDVQLYEQLDLERAQGLVPIELVRLAANLKRVIIDEQKYTKVKIPTGTSKDNRHQVTTVPRSFVVLPVLLNDQVVAVAYLSNDQVPNLFSGRKIELLTILASQAVVSLEKHQMYTELKLANHRLEDHAGQLEALVEERTTQIRIRNESLSKEIARRVEIEAELVNAKEAAEAATAMKSRFLATMSHELRTPDGGSVSVETHMSLMGEATEQGDRPALLKVIVQDSGIGIAEQDHSKLFRFFSQVDDSTTRKFGGTGLGLAISKRICKLFSGDLTVESEVGKGSTFTAIFVLTVNAKTHPLEILESTILRNKRCLVLEPAPLLRKSLQAAPLKLWYTKLRTCQSRRDSRR